MTPLGWILFLLFAGMAGLWLREMGKMRARLLAELAAHARTNGRLATAQLAHASADGARADLAAQMEALTSEKADLTSENGELYEQLRAARAIVPLPAPAPRTPTPEERSALLAAKCAHCGGVHAIACPRVRRMRFRADGQSLYEVEFWQDDQWDKGRVVWPEDLYEEPHGETSPSLSAPSAAA